MKQITCKHCKYQWRSRSRLEYVSCPSCLQKTRIKITEKIPPEPEIRIKEDK